MTRDFFDELEKCDLGYCADKMAEYAGLVLKVNEHMNLTRITDPREMAIKHFEDSAHPDILAFIPQNARVIDVGTGGGFPGVPIKLAREDVGMTFMESVGKKLEFVKNACESMGIEGEFICARAEETADLREKFDVCVSRAVAALPVLLELCSPLVKVGGIVLAYKGANADEEIAAAKSAAAKLNLSLIKKQPVNTPGAEHCVLVYKKTAPTPKAYPRRFAQIKKHNL